MSDDLQVNVKGALLELVLNRPDKYNAINDAILSGLVEQVVRFNADAGLRVLLLRAGGRFFSAGGDVNSSLFPDLSHESPTQFREWLFRSSTSLSPLTDLIASCEKPTIVAHQGPCLGGALELSLAFDFRIASDTAYFALPETRLGAVPSSGGVARLTRLVGPSWARWLLVAGERVDAAKAERIGLVHAVHAADAFEAEIDSFCQRVQEMPREAATAAKLAIDLADELGEAGGRKAERLVASSLVFGNEYRDELAKVMERLNRKG